MITVVEHTVEKLIDPTGILGGDRYEFILNLEVPEDDELYSDNGIKIKAIYVIDGFYSKLAQYYIIESGTEEVLDFELEEEEETMIKEYCARHIPSE
ncbi:DUF6509 family protein [Litchfieldia alkalitelluris]|uniref:DUF6509 family protein n=1 Tax=Litchfieldia alkalitelluris TaxID=304268 RepID=UPI002E26B854